MVKIILFNGPPRSGKDTCTTMALDHLGKSAVHYRFAAPLKDAVHGLFGMGNVKQEAFDFVKNDPSEMLMGMSPREAYIWMSEEVVKPKFGRDFFAGVAVNAIKNIADDKTVVISDCGFDEEVRKLIKAFGVYNVAIVYVKREGCSFAKDSRDYVTDVVCRQFGIENNGSYGDLNKQVIKILNEFIGAK